MSKDNSKYIKRFDDVAEYCHINVGTIIDISFICLVAFLSISWFRGDYLINELDFSMPLDRLRSFSANFYMWDVRSFGAANPRILSLTFPIWAYFALSDIVGLSLVNTEKIFFYLIFVTSGLSMYYLSSTLLSQSPNKFRRLASLISGIFFMLNPYVAINIMPLRQISWTIYALLPLIFGAFIKSLDDRKSFRYTIITAFIMLLATSAYVDPSFVPLTFIPLFFYICFFIITNLKRDVISHSLKSATILFVIFVLLNIYWLFPDAYFASAELEKVTSSYSAGGSSFQDIVKLNSAPMFEAFRLLGHWALHSGYKEGYPYYAWASSYQTTFFILIGFMIPFFAFTTILLKPRDKNVLFFTIFALISLFLVNGSNSYFGRWLFVNLPLFAPLFNTPYLRFELYVTLSYAFLIGYTLSIFHAYVITSNWMKKVYSLVLSKISVGLILFLIVGVYAFPLWTGDAVYSGNDFKPSVRYKIPHFYFEATEWLHNDNEDFRILPIPIAKLGYASYKWEDGGFNGPDPTEWLFPKKVITSALNGYDIDGLISNSMNGDDVNIGKILALMNVKYVLFHRDTNWAYIEDQTIYNSNNYGSMLNKNGFYLEKSFGQLDFYKNTYFRPMQIYATNNFYIISNSTQKIEFIESKENMPGEFILLESNQINDVQRKMFTELSKHNNSIAYFSIRYNKINPTKYIVHINTTQPIFLVFSDSYQSGWTAYVNKEDTSTNQIIGLSDIKYLFMKQIDDKYHYIGNGYANAWYIDPQELGTDENFTITLYFKPQYYFYIGLIITCLTFMGCVGYLLRDRRKRKTAKLSTESTL